jgi:calcium/calmodulin-dependent protein kinase I
MLRMQRAALAAARASKNARPSATAPVAALAALLAATTLRTDEQESTPRCHAAAVAWSPLQQSIVANQRDSWASPQQQLRARYNLSPSSLGAGANACVYRGVDNETGESVAIKQMARLRTSETAVRDETSILAEAVHDNIIQLRGCYADDSNFYLVMELAAGGELYEKLCREGMLTESTAKLVMQQVLQAVSYLHSRSIVHADLKPENLLITSSPGEELKVKIADFGSAHSLLRGSSEKRKDYTACYIPPELITGAAAEVTTAADVWALGVVMYILLRGCHPFDLLGCASEADVMRAVVETEPDFSGEQWAGVSASAKALVQRAMSKDAALRPTAAEMLADPWLTSVATSAAAAVVQQ